MTYRLSVTPMAEADIDSTAAYIARDSIPAALRFYDAVKQTFDQIRSHPRRWPRYEIGNARLAELRKVSVKDFRNNLVFYTVSQDSVLVIRVLHGARDISSILDLRAD